MPSDHDQSHPASSRARHVAFRAATSFWTLPPDLRRGSGAASGGGGAGLRAGVLPRGPGPGPDHRGRQEAVVQPDDLLAASAALDRRGRSGRARGLLEAGSRPGSSCTPASPSRCWAATGSPPRSTTNRAAHHVRDWGPVNSALSWVAVWVMLFTRGRPARNPGSRCSRAALSLSAVPVMYALGGNIAAASRRVLLHAWSFRISWC